MHGSKAPKDRRLRRLMGRRLRSARYAYDPNAAAVARELGVPSQVLSSYETGTRFPAELFLVRFCNLVGCPVDWIMRGVMHAETPPRIAAHMALAYPEVVTQALTEEQRSQDFADCVATLRTRVGLRLRAARVAYDADAADVGTSALASQLEVTTKVLSAYETGRNYPDEAFLLRFSDLTGVPLDWVFRGRMTATMDAAMSCRIALAEEEAASRQMGGQSDEDGLSARSAAGHGVASEYIRSV